jgi:hypothetical protein
MYTMKREIKESGFLLFVFLKMPPALNLTHMAKRRGGRGEEHIWYP